MLEEATTSTGEEQGSSQELLAKADIKKREKKGLLKCGNVSIDSEIIYWKQVFLISLTNSLNPLLTHSLIHSLTHSLTHSLNHSITHSLTHSCLSLL